MRVSKSLLPLFVLCLSLYFLVLPVRAATLPMQQRSDLLNGLKLVVVERPGEANVTATLVTFAGADADESGKAGTADLTAHLLLASTPQRKRAQIAQDLSDSGLTASSYADYDASWFRISGPAANLRDILEQMSDLVLNSDFDPAELAAVKEETVAELTKRRADPASLADLYFHEKLFGLHPYAYSPAGMPFTLKDITVADCKSFYQRFYHPNDAILVVVGGIRADDVIQRTRVLWGAWKNTSISPVFPKPARQPVGVLIRVGDLPGAETAQIRVGRVGVQRTSRDYYSLEMLNFILGGEGFNSRFADRLQKKDHLTKDVSSRFEYHRSGGDWMVSLSTPAPGAAAAVADIIDEIKKFQTTLVSQNELSDAAATLSARLTSQIQSNDQIADAIANIEVYNLAYDAYGAYSSYLNRITPEQIQQAAREYLDPDSLVVVVVGNDADMREALARLGKVEVFPGR